MKKFLGLALPSYTNNLLLLNKKITAICLVCLFGFNANAQLQVLRKAVEQINSYKNFKYHKVTKQKSVSGDTSTVIENLLITNSFIDGKTVELFKSENSITGYTTIYNGSSHFYLNPKDNTYYLYKNPILTHSPFYWANFIKEELEKSPDKISMRPDTVINRTNCYHFRFTLFNEPPAHTIYDIYLNKSTYLPVYTREYLKGKMGKEGYESKEISSLVTSFSYSNYIINRKNFLDISSLTIPANYNPEKQVALLKSRERMPDWKLTDASGRSYSSNDFKGKVTLVEFTFNACGACVLAVPVMKHLHDKYSGSVQIININTIDNRESVSRFATKHAIPFPILINGKAVGKISQVSSYPTIYLIDREGNIFFASKGYNDELEKTLIEQIDKVI